MLIPRTPSPTPEPTAAPAPVSAPVSAMSLEERPIGELTMAEMIELAKRQQVSLHNHSAPIRDRC